MFARRLIIQRTSQLVTSAHNNRSRFHCKQLIQSQLLINYFSTEATTAATTNNNVKNDYSNENSNSVNDIKQKLLQSALEQVPIYGWTNDAIAQAVAASSLSSSSSSMALAGLITVPDLISYSMNKWNEQLKQDIIKSRDKSTSTSLKEHIMWSIQHRLQMVQELIHVSRWHEGMALGIHPDSIVITQKQLAELIDIILDSSTHEKDFSIPERISLGAVYVTTELHMLSDESHDYQDTWEFLKQRVNNWETLRQFQPPIIPVLPTVDIFHNNSPSDILFTVSTIGSAFATGVMSLVMSPNNSSSNSNNTATSAQQQQQQQHVYTGQGNDTNTNYSGSASSIIIKDFDGTDPRHYDVPNTTSKTEK